MNLKSIAFFLVYAVVAEYPAHSSEVTGFERGDFRKGIEVNLQRGNNSSVFHGNDLRNLLYFDTVNNRIGISTGSPQDLLDIAGSIRISGSIRFDSSLTVSSLTVTYGVSAGSLTVTSVVTADTITARGNQFSVGTSTFVVSLGSVGVGVLLPAAALEVAGSVRFDADGRMFGPIGFGSGTARSTFTASGLLRLPSGNNSGVGLPIAFGPDGDDGIHSATNNQFSFSITGVDKFTVRSDVLVVADAIEMPNGSAAGPFIRGASGNANTGPFYPTDDNDQWAWSINGVEAMRLDENSRLGIGVQQPTAKVQLSSGTLLVDGNTAVIITTGSYVATPSSITIASSGDANPATYTLDPLAGFVSLTCNDADTCDITMAETNARDGQTVEIINMSAANVVDFADSAGVSELNAAFAMGPYDSLKLKYSRDRWVEMSRSNN